MAVCINALAIASIFIGSAADTMLPIVGTLYGEEDAVGIRGAAKAASRIMMVSCAVIVLFFLGWPEVVGGWFGITSAQDLRVMVPALRMFALSLPFFAVNNLLQNFYATTGREKLASAMAVLDGFVFVVLFALALSRVDGGLLWLCFLCSEAATLGTALLMGWRVRRKEKIGGVLLFARRGFHRAVGGFDPRGGGGGHRRFGADHRPSARRRACRPSSPTGWAWPWRRWP